ncbi:uncharacterized protein LOC132471091 [Gadus macrocephalus]|uniref:uncharacterized protein LOC132471091 n=1 Tax=Gadus macrocephalus TaxID=80720 RepID=UPI0028CBB62B|nr:uncharacterized protein LOC132471091 [Gadus macrocephalus]
MSALDAFWEAPSESLLLKLTVKQLIEVAERYSIEITLPKTARKDRLVDLICESLKVKDVLPFFCSPIVDPVMEQSPGQKSESAMAYSGLSFEEQKVILQMQLEHKRFDAEEREQERLLEQDKLRLEHLCLDLMAEGKYGNSKQPSSLASMVKFLPKFNERDPDVFFSLFESVASDLEWTGEEQVLFAGEVTIAVRPSLPVDGIDLILGNNLGHGSVFPFQSPPPPVVSRPTGGELSVESDECSEEFPKVFTACAVTRAVARAQVEDSSGVPVVLAKMVIPVLPAPLSVDGVIEAQKEDATLEGCLSMIVDDQGVERDYFIQDGLPLAGTASGQVVVHTQSVGTPFEHQIIDCVGPLPESGSGIGLKRDWAEGLPWLLLAARAVVQESTGFGPSDLVFGHRVRTPLSVLGSELGGTEPPESLADHVQGFHRKLFLAWKMASENRGRALKRMKTPYDRGRENVME